MNSTTPNPARDTAVCASPKCDRSVVGRRRDAKFCSDRCMQVAYWARRRTPAPREDRCAAPNCGASMRGKRANGKYCSLRCQQLAAQARHREALSGRKCANPGCGASLDGRRANTTACSRPCQRIVARLRDPDRVRGQERASKARHSDAVRARKKRYYAENRDLILPKMKANYEANRELAAEANRRRYERDGAAIREKTRQYRQAHPEKTAASRARYQMRKQNATVEEFDPVEVFDRDGWVCQICTQPIDPKIRYPDHECASLDHIIPLSRDGEHSRVNTQASHLRCNKRKHARLSV